MVEVDLLRSRDPRSIRPTLVQVTVNGTNIKALIDSGAPTSLLSLAAAKRSGIEPGGTGVVPVSDNGGIGPRKVRNWIAPVQSFAIGTEVIRNTRLRIGEMDIDGIDMLLGADFLLAHRVYVANSQDMVYFTYGGGPVFNLSNPPASARASAEENGEFPNSDTAPTDAAGFARRGAARASRREFDLAIADLDQACQLEPSAGHYFAERGRVRLLMGQRAPGTDDLNEALRLDPRDVDARIARAKLFASDDNHDPARLDLQALDQQLAPQDNYRRDMGILYLRIDQPDRALAEFNQWITTHEDDANLPEVRNSRCWTRTLLGSELSEALKDCEASVSRMPGKAGPLASRGFVYLRMNEFEKAIADFNRALEINPKQTWPLYGRALAQLRKGMQTEGNADLAAANAIDPRVEKEASQYGLAP